MSCGPAKACAIAELALLAWTTPQRGRYAAHKQLSQWFSETIASETQDFLRQDSIHSASLASQYCLMKLSFQNFRLVMDFEKRSKANVRCSLTDDHVGLEPVI